ncbi:hypothetical protein [Chitinophaga polysaccharea]|uniref:hypothetical protein n=1 Tax=Chitinophaga polysaccharea TaxID=1293035 RepID=UPI0011585B90|nr:hypothetical protein [Chitinophaga polysaccharea]
MADQKMKIYSVDRAKRRILTIKNMEELGITDELLLGLLNTVPEFAKNKLNQKGDKVGDKQIRPVGLSINDKKVGNFPDPNAAKRGWITFFEIGTPLFEERSNIIPPVADVLSTRSYENRSGEDSQFSDTVEFTMENTINWSLAATGTPTFEGEISGELQAEISKTVETILEESLANGIEKKNSKEVEVEHIVHNHKDEMGTEDHVEVEEEAEVTTTTEFTATNSNSVSFTGTGTATGHGELEVELELSLKGTISGTVTTSWKSTSNVSGRLPKDGRVETLATQRRQIKQFTYEVPIVFEGVIGLSYDDFVEPFDGSSSDREIPDLFDKDRNKIKAAKVIPAHISTLKLHEKGAYRPIGIAETISTLDVNHVIFGKKVIDSDSPTSKIYAVVRPHNL